MYESFKLDPARYFTLPGLAWDVMLKYTKIELDFLDDVAMYPMIESGLRRGIWMISNKYDKTNNPYDDGYDNKSINYITYLHTDNLNGWDMSQYLPEKEICWLTEQQISHLDITNISDDSPIGYMLEVDLEYLGKPPHT